MLLGTAVTARHTQLLQIIRILNLITIRASAIPAQAHLFTTEINGAAREDNPVNNNL
jgi:hypothetical protein